jgi:hypothetical protein
MAVIVSLAFHIPQSNELEKKVEKIEPKSRTGKRIVKKK